MKLISITLPSSGRLGSPGTVLCDAPSSPLLKGFTVRVRGPVILLVSPAGWVKGEPAGQRDPGGPSRTFEFPRSECQLEWEGAIDEAVQKYDSPPIMTPAERQALADERLAQLTELAELEKATAPEPKKK